MPIASQIRSFAGSYLVGFVSGTIQLLPLILWVPWAYPDIGCFRHLEHSSFRTFCKSRESVL